MIHQLGIGIKVNELELQFLSVFPYTKDKQTQVAKQSNYKSTMNNRVFLETFFCENA